MIYSKTYWQQRQSYLEEVARSFRQRNPERFYYYRLLVNGKISGAPQPWHRFRRGSGYTLFMLTHSEDIQRMIDKNPEHWLEK